MAPLALRSVAAGSLDRGRRGVLHPTGMISRHGPDHVGAGKHQLVLSHASTQVTPTKEEITWNGGGEPAWPGPSMTNQRRSS
jgi:hypothetical protein